jgi:hypothetical protein
MSHRHYCDFAGHDWQCSEGCECICGLPMEGHDYSDCSVELRACPEHAAEQERRIAEALASEPDDGWFVQRCRERESALPHCECGCAEAESSDVIGWCLHCDHVYVSYGPEIADIHLADNCPDPPDELKKSARERLLKHQAGK